MKKQMQVGLVVEGNITSSGILRLPCLAEELGPIKSVTLQVARRVSNFIRAGYAVSEYQELSGAPMILLHAPDGEMPRVVAELCESGLKLSEMSFVLCESWLATETLIPLRQLGAQIASLVTVGPPGHNCFAVEGDLAAIRRIKRLLSQCDSRVIELRPGSKPLYFAADVLAGAITIPLFQLAQQMLRDCGVSGNDLALVSHEWLDQLQTRVKKGGRGTWGGPLSECSEGTAEGHFGRLAVEHAELAATVQDWLGLARRQMTKRAKGQGA